MAFFGIPARPPLPAHRGNRGHCDNDEDDADELAPAGPPPKNAVATITATVANCAARTLATATGPAIRRSDEREVGARVAHAHTATRQGSPPWQRSPGPQRERQHPYECAHPDEQEGPEDPEVVGHGRAEHENHAPDGCGESCGQGPLPVLHPHPSPPGRPRRWRGEGEHGAVYGVSPAAIASAGASRLRRHDRRHDRDRPRCL